LAVDKFSNSQLLLKVGKKSDKKTTNFYWWFGGAPREIRTPVLALKGLRPGPLDDGGINERDFIRWDYVGQGITIKFVVFMVKGNGYHYLNSISLCLYSSIHSAVSLKGELTALLTI
jgi:hypothetical protein